MKKHQVIFEKTKELLKRHFEEDLKECEDGAHLTINDTGIWIASDDRELTIGYGLTHNHYDPEYDDLNQAIERFFNLLTRRKRITEFLKVDFSYKHKTEIELYEGKYEQIGTAITWFFPFWKRTTKRITFENRLINFSVIEMEIEEIRKLCTTKA